MSEINLGTQYKKTTPNESLFGVALAFVADSLASAYTKATAAGATSISVSVEKPWGKLWPISTPKKVNSLSFLTDGWVTIRFE